jgi:hypothetical protein
MDIQRFYPRHHADSSNLQHMRAIDPPTPTDDVPATAPATDAAAAPSTADAPATTQHLSRGGLFMGLMQTYETQHPEEAKTFLNNVADKLRADAKFAGPFFGFRMNRWADRFEKAADSGDLSNLLPQPFGHFGTVSYTHLTLPTM